MSNCDGYQYVARVLISVPTAAGSRIVGDWSLASRKEAFDSRPGNANGCLDLLIHTWHLCRAPDRIVVSLTQ